MGTSTGHVMTIANSIIGVSVLAMPFCFKQCGIVLSILLLLLSGIMTRLACHYLLKSAITARRRNFEFLAFHAFGPTGKLFVELGVIGFMLGTCIAFFVVMGDLGPVIIGPALNIDSFSTLRPSVLMGLGLLVVLPLGLLRNVDSLSAICAASVAFYLCLVLKVMGEAATHLISWDWVDKVNLWRPAGIPQCIPIFSMALSCQTQIFEIFDSVPNTSLEKMNAVIKSAINMCTAVYISVGFFGYVAFCTQNFSGNLLMSFSPTILSEIIKLGFVLSVAVSFPLVIFPCRASLHSLLFRRGHTPHYELLSAGGNYIPEPRFKCLTIFIVMFSLGTGLLIPSIEVVLGLVGSTIGIMICIIFPALTFICISNKNNNERLVAQGLFALGLIIMVLGTYTNLYATEEALTKPDIEIQKIIPPPLKMPSNIAQIPLDPPDLKDKQKSFSDKVDGIVKEVATQAPLETKKEIVIENIPEEVNSNKRKEPPVPVAPGDNIVKENILPPVPSDLSDNEKENKVDKIEEKLSDNAEKVQVQSKNEEIISNDAINREEEEIKEAGDRNLEIQKKNEDLLDKLKKHEAEQKKLIEEQKALLEELKKQNQQQKEKIDISAENKLKDIKTEDKQARELLKKPIINVPKDTSKIDVPEELPKVPIVKTVDKPVAVDQVLVKSDVNSNISVNRSVNNTPPISKNKNLSPSLTNKMVEGVPLPIAVKGNIIVDKKPDNKLKAIDNKLEDTDNNMRHIDNQLKNIETKKVNEVQENKPMVRDILNDKVNADVKEEREKRDLDFVEKSENLIQTNVNKVVKNQPYANKDQQKIQEDVLLKDNADDNSENCEKDDKEIKIEQNKEPVVDSHIKPNLNVNISNSNNDNKPIESRQELQAVQNDLGNKEEKFKVVTEQSLIKTPSYLSQPELPPLNAVNIKNADNNIMGGIKEIKPQLRDLKSIGTQDEKLDRRQERASEIT